MFNEIDGDFDDVVIRTFKVRLPAEHGLRKSLIGKPATSVRQLMDQIDEYKRVEENQQQGKGKVRFSLRRWEISGQTATTIIDPKGILLGNLRLRLLKWLIQCSENQYIKPWRKSRMSHTLNGQTRWKKTPWGTTKVLIASTTRNEDTPLRIVKFCGTIWSNWPEMKGYNSFCIGPIGKETKQGHGLSGILLQGLLWA